MTLFRCLSRPLPFDTGVVATIGNFDGVHRGHCALLAVLREEATARRMPLVVLVFEPQPSEYFNRQNAPARLYALRDKVAALRQCGVDYVFCLKFDKRLASMSPLDFADTVIMTRLNARYLLLGEDFRFGCDRQGDLVLLKEWASSHGIVLNTYPDYCLNQRRVSSTQIRQALCLGNLEQASALLGRPYSLIGRVQHGQGIGRQWGVPTANLNLRRGTLPLKGVFCVQVERYGHPFSFGVANMGTRPTIDGRKSVLEVHLFDCNESLYGEFLQVTFLHKLRDEMTFPSVDRLIAQIHMDVIAAQNFINNLNSKSTPNG